MAELTAVACDFALPLGSLCSLPSSQYTGGGSVQRPATVLMAVQRHFSSHGSSTCVKSQNTEAARECDFMSPEQSAGIRCSRTPCPQPRACGTAAISPLSEQILKRRRVTTPALPRVAPRGCCRACETHTWLLRLARFVAYHFKMLRIAKMLLTPNTGLPRQTCVGRVILDTLRQGCD